MWLPLAPQTKDLTAAPPNLTARALRKHRKWRHHDLVAPLISDLPMGVEGEAAGGRATAAHVDCCVLCVLCCGASCLLATDNTEPTF